MWAEMLGELGDVIAVPLSHLKLQQVMVVAAGTYVVVVIHVVAVVHVC